MTSRQVSGISVTKRQARSSSASFFSFASITTAVAVNCFDGVAPHSVSEVREALEVADDIPIVECDARNRNSVKMVLLEMAEHALRRASSLVRG